jgi:3-(3-hydroxy-phenyl)propionate hydroxylase
LVGRLCPQPASRDGGWFDDTLGDGFALVTLDPAPPAADLTIVRIGPDSELGRWLERGSARAALVRPDRVVAATIRRRDDFPRLVIPHHVAKGIPA